jgi:hypothetical protein
MDSTAHARRLKELLIELSPLIEEYTSAACPGCRDVCCKQKRSFPEAVDIRYFSLLGQPLPLPDPALDPEGPCQFMGEAGCNTARWLRPWRCTWYFCLPLLDAMGKGPQKKARNISRLIQEIVAIRTNLS